MADFFTKLICTVVTPKAQIVEAEATDVVLPAHDGLLGVRPGHAPLLCNLGTGLLRYYDTTGQEHLLFINGGFGHILDNKVTILTRQAISSDDISPLEAQEMLHQADNLPMSTIEEVEARSTALRLAKSLIKLTSLDSHVT